MKSLRVVLVTRRFWPLVGGAEIAMARLASEFLRRGGRPTVMTAHWDSAWPASVVHRETPVIRLPSPPVRGWGTLRYLRSLARWLRRHRREIDVVCVSMLKHDAYAAIGAMRPAGIPVVVRAEGGGATGDCQWQQRARWGGRIRRRCMLADALVAPSEAIRKELQEAGYPSERIHWIPNGAPVGPAPRPEAKGAARESLAEANPALAVPGAGPVVLFTSRLERAKGVFELVEAWPPIASRWPGARLWLAGDGPDREALWERIVEMGLHHEILLPGVFDETDELLQAADLFVLPSYEEGMSLSLLEAMAAGLPIVASDIPGNRALIVDGKHGLLAPPGSVSTWSERMMALLESPRRGAAMGAAARQRVQAEFSMERMADRHWELFEQLAASAPASVP